MNRLYVSLALCVVTTYAGQLVYGLPGGAGGVGLSPGCQFPGTGQCPAVESAQEYCSAAVQHLSVQQYMLSLFQCVIDGVSLVPNTCPSMAFALDAYLFKADPRKNCMYQGGLLCQNKQAIEDLTIKASLPDHSFQRKLDSAFQKMFQYC